MEPVIVVTRPPPSTKTQIVADRRTWVNDGALPRSRSIPDVADTADRPDHRPELRASCIDLDGRLVERTL